MQVGFIGSGNMAGALARGWGDPVLCTDSGSGRAAKLAQELGGEAFASNAELVKRADVIILAHKPAQLRKVAAEIGETSKPVVSLLARTPQSDVEDAYPNAPVFRVEPNIPVAVRKGAIAFAESDEEVASEIKALFERVGTVVTVPERLMTVAGAISGVGPAYWALIVEGWIDTAVRHGMPAAQAATLVVETMAGSAALLTDTDTLALRRAVTSPGGTTARGLDALERGGVRAALAAAMDGVVKG